MDKNKYLGGQRDRRRFRVRKHIRGSSERPRLSVFRSHRNLACQIIDDTSGKTLVAERAKAAGVEGVVFDRAGNKYHGRVAALADGAREGGLAF